MSWRAVKPMRRYGDFSISQDGGRHHLGFINFQNYNCRNAQEFTLRYRANFFGDRSNFGEDRPIFPFSQYRGFPPSWICDARVWTIHEGHLVVFITVQNLIGIDAVVSITCTFCDFTSFPWKCLFRPRKWGFWGDSNETVHRLQIRPIVHN